MPFEREECWALIGVHDDGAWRMRRRRPSAGTRTQVAFDAAWVLAREEKHGDVVGFYHTHPPGHLALSQRDVRTMRAWVSAFGKALLCVIESDGARAAYCFDNDTSNGRKIESVTISGKGFYRGADHNGGTNSSRSDLPRRGTNRQAGAGTHRPVRRGRARVQPRGQSRTPGR